jgi:hypothetical protein
MAHGILLADLGNDAVSLSGNTVALCAMAGLVVGACDSNSIAFDEASGNAKANVVAGNAMAGLVVQGSAEAVADLAAIQDESVGDKVNFTSAVFGPNLGPNVLEPQIEWPVATVRGVLGPGDLSLCIPPACTD